MTGTWTPRRLVVIAVENYNDGNLGFSDEIRAQVAIVTGWLAHPGMDEERRFQLARPKQLNAPEDLRTFLAEERLAEAEYDQSLVVYITGHGVAGKSGRHYLTFVDTSTERLLATAFPTSELITAVMDSEAEHVLVIVDSCFAGGLRDELPSLLKDLRPGRRSLRTLAVVTSGDFENKPQPGQFTALLKGALERASDESAGFTLPHLSFEDWEKLLKAAGKGVPDLAQVLWVWPDSRDEQPSMCLPNPHYRSPAQVVERARRQLSLSVETLEQYWLSRASGRTDDGDPGWYFSGRRELMRALVAFVRGGEGVLVVTGAAGSGKSALLARLVTLSDPLFVQVPRYAEMVRAVPAGLSPEPGSVDAAVLGRGRSSLELVEDLLAAFGETAAAHEPPLQVLLTRIAAVRASVGRPVTVVIDGVDEAQQPTACLSDVIAPLARLRTDDGQPAVRLVLGMRSSAQGGEDGRLRDDAADQLLDLLGGLLRQGFGEENVGLERLRTDGGGTEADIDAYVRTVIESAEGSPYTGNEEAVADAAAVIARAVTPSFLDARLAAARLRTAATRQDVHDPGWLNRLHAGTTALLADDLRQVAADHGVGAPLLLAVLRATAFAQGAGLPWAEVWPAFTAAVLGPGTPPQDGLDAVIRTVRGSRLVGYLTTGEEDGRLTYRPVHQRIAEVLLHEPGTLLFDPLSGVPEEWAREQEGVRSAEVIHASIARACARLAREAGELAPHPYVARHTVAHAYLGGVLDDSVMPTELAVRESSGTLRARLGIPLPVHDPFRRVLTAAGLIEPYLDASVGLASRRASIRFHLAAATGSTTLGGGEDAEPLEPRIVQWMPRADVVAAPRGYVYALCALRTLDGRSLICTGTRDGAEVWDASTGQRLAHIAAGEVRDLAVAEGTSGRSFLVTAGPEGAAMFDPLSGRRLATLSVPAVEVRVLGDGANRWLIAVLTKDGFFLWQPSEELVRQVPVPERARRVWSRGVWIRERDGRTWRVFRSVDDTALLFDPVHGESIELGLQVPSTTFLAAVPGPEVHDLLAMAHRDGRVELCAVLSRGRTTELPTVGERVVELTDARGRRVLGVVGASTVALWATWKRHPEKLTRVAAPPARLLAGVPLPEGGWGLASYGDEGVVLNTESRETHPLPEGGEWHAGHDLLEVRGMARVEDPEAGELLALVTDDALWMCDPVTRETRWSLRRMTTFGAAPVVVAIPGGDSTQGAALLFEDRAGHHVWHARSGAVRHVARKGRCLPLRLPDGRLCLVLAHNRRVEMQVPGEDERRPMESPGEVIYSLAALPFTPGRRLVGGLGREHLWIWDLADGRLVDRAALELGHSEGRAVCVVPLPNGRSAFAAPDAHGITLWDTDGWQPLTRIETPRPSALTVVPWRDGAPLLASGSGSGLRLWEPSTGRLVRSLLTAAPVTSIVHTTAGGDRLHIGGRAGLATLAWPQER